MVDPTSARDSVAHACRLLHAIAFDKELHEAVSSLLGIENEVISQAVVSQLERLAARQRNLTRH